MKFLDTKNLKDTGTEVAGLASGLAVGYAANKYIPDVSVVTGFKKSAALAVACIMLAPVAPKGFVRNAVVGASAMNAIMGVSQFTSTSTLPGMSAANEILPQIAGVGAPGDEFLGNAFPEMPAETAVVESEDLL